MNEIHAYRNEDGTYNVKAFGTAVELSEDGKTKIEKEFIQEIPRALVNIDVLDNSTNKLFTVEFREGNWKWMI